MRQEPGKRPTKVAFNERDHAIDAFRVARALTHDLGQGSELVCYTHKTASNR
jgi:hypothetical protein